MSFKFQALLIRLRRRVAVCNECFEQTSRRCDNTTNVYITRGSQRKTLRAAKRADKLLVSRDENTKKYPKPYHWCIVCGYAGDEACQGGDIVLKTSAHDPGTNTEKSILNLGTPSACKVLQYKILLCTQSFSATSICAFSFDAITEEHQGKQKMSIRISNYSSLIKIGLQSITCNLPLTLHYVLSTTRHHVPQRALQTTNVSFH